MWKHFAFLLLFLFALISCSSLQQSVEISGLISGKRIEDCDSDEIRELLELISKENPLCSEWKDDKCLKCSTRSYFNFQRICQEIDPQCAVFDEKNTKCTSCYSGYDLKNEKCVLVGSNNWAQENPLCSVFDGNKCLKCSIRSYFNEKGICTMVSPDCKSFNEFYGFCTTCYDGFQLINGNCLKEKSNQSNGDPLCSKFLNGKCIECSSSSYFGKDGVCIGSDPNCATFSRENGSCLTCYQGYFLKSGKCLQQNIEFTSNPNCAQWDREICIKCSYRSFMTLNQRCEPVNPLCKTFDETTGKCLSCYPGYNNWQGQCIESSQTNEQSNRLCSEWKNQKCQKCSFRSYFNNIGICLEIDPLCASFNETSGQCYSCYSGYALSNGKCSIGNTITNTDPFCSEWENQKCKKCSARYYISDSGICLEIDSNCKTFSYEKRICLECYTGYSVNEKIQSCQKILLKDPECSDVSPEGKCLKCNNNWNLINGKCFKFKNMFSFDSKRCALWKEGKCLKCATGLVLNTLGQCSCICS